MSYARFARPALALSAALLVGHASPQAQRPVVLKLWHNRIASSESFQKEIAAFEKANPGIKVEITPTSGQQYTQVVNLAFKSNNAPDVFVIPTDGGVTIQDAIDSGWLLPLNKWATKGWQATFPAGSFAEGINVFDGKVYSAPWASNAANYLALYINNKVFRDAGLVDRNGKVLVPRTWAEQRKFAQQIVQRTGGKAYGLGFGAKQGDYVMNIQMQSLRASGVPAPGNTDLGYYYFNYKTGRFEFATNPLFRQWFEHWIDMKQDGSILPQSVSLNDEQIRPVFAEGKFGMYVNGGWVVPSLKQTNPGFEDYTVAPLPVRGGPSSTAYYRTIPASFELGVSSKTGHPEEAWKLFSFLNSRASANRWVSYGEAVRVWPETAKLAKGRAGDVARVLVSQGRVAPAFNALRPGLADVKFQEPTPNIEYYVLAAYTGQLKKSDLPNVLKDLENRYNQALDDAIATARKGGSKVTRADFAFPNWDPGKDQATVK
ncbi:ABC transporter substrate-binding protein (plasmid) [Deinococcus aetherius]|uniref:ABC transporter substrate-binding protein n=1 Tax=Deinococcus aetherius TaxID=200252 RepID=A0ABM8AJC7_9DEIO|nr:sugar ABC transporter substrate-binding protein [Deinococcus aetherius]BDP43943.1 ABC transporter substrate-binding protein [Deinococcus aetherius]